MKRFFIVVLRLFAYVILSDALVFEFLGHLPYYRLLTLSILGKEISR